MGVLNANDDSFYKQSHFTNADALKKINTMIEEGSDIIDIGAVSSRPGSVGISEEEELLRLKEIVNLIYTNKLYEKNDFSLDTYSPLCATYALDRGFKIINDITGLADDKVCELVSSHQAQVIIMHMQGTPQTMQENPHYEDVLTDVESFFKERIEKARAFGIKDIVLDVGIGFGKSLEHNLQLIKHLSHFQKLHLPLLIGASRKSMIDKIIPANPSDRLAGTLALHLKAVEEGASIVRCHDVKEHFQALKIMEVLDKTTI